MTWKLGGIYRSRRDTVLRMENQMEKSMNNEMEIGIALDLAELGGGGGHLNEGAHYNRNPTIQNGIRMISGHPYTRAHLQRLSNLSPKS